MFHGKYALLFGQFEVIRRAMHRFSTRAFDFVKEISREALLLTRPNPNNFVTMKDTRFGIFVTERLPNQRRKWLSQANFSM